MTARCEATVMSLLGVAKKYQKFYCWVSQKRLEELIEKYHEIGLSNRTLNRDLRWLEDNGYISRLRRLRVDKEGKLVFCSTLYKFTGKLFNWLNSMGNRVKRLFSHFRLPKLADYQLLQKQASSIGASASVEFRWVKERDGTISRYDPRTGEYLKGMKAPS
jgi:DNA-binding transcriptional ArsR family regulator